MERFMGPGWPDDLYPDRAQGFVPDEVDPRYYDGNYYPDIPEIPYTRGEPDMPPETHPEYPPAQDGLADETFMPHNFIQFPERM
jgi:hypothetical protein